MAEQMKPVRAPGGSNMGFQLLVCGRYFITTEEKMTAGAFRRNLARRSNQVSVIFCWVTPACSSEQQRRPRYSELASDALIRLRIGFETCCIYAVLDNDHFVGAIPQFHLLVSRRLGATDYARRNVTRQSGANPGYSMSPPIRERRV